MGAPDWALQELQELEAGDKPAEKPKRSLTREEVLATIAGRQKPVVRSTETSYRPDKKAPSWPNGGYRFPVRETFGSEVHYDPKREDGETPTTHSQRQETAWQAALDRAKAEQTPIRRSEGGVADAVRANLNQFGLGALDTHTFGQGSKALVERDPELQSIAQSDVPGIGISEIAGNVAGYLSPLSLEGRAISAVAKAAAPGVNTVSQMVGGAAGGATDMAARDALERGKNAVQGKESQPLVDSAFDVLGGGVVGGAVPAVAGAGKGIAGWLVDYLRSVPGLGSLINNVEAAGGRTSANPLRPGMKAPPAVKEAQEIQSRPIPSRREQNKSIAATEYGKEAQDITANRAAESLHSAAKQFREMIPAEIREGVQLPYMATPQGQHRVSAEPVMNAVKAYTGSKHLGGENRPPMTHFEGGEPSELLKRLQTKVVPEGPIPNVSGHNSSRAGSGRHMGIPQDRPITYNAAELEAEIRGWQYAISNKRAAQQSHEFEDVVLKALRDLRGRFQPHPEHAPEGWAAEMAGTEERMATMEEALGILGLDRGVNQIDLADPKQRAAILNFVRGYRRPGSMNVDESPAFRELMTGAPTADEQLINAVGHRDYDALRKQSNPLTSIASLNIPGALGNAGRWVGLHLDPAMQHLSGKYRGGRTAPSGHVSQVLKNLPGTREPARAGAAAATVTNDQMQAILDEYRRQKEQER